MADSFLFPISGKVLEMIGSPLVQRISLAWGMKDDLQKLENTLSSVRAVLLDADQKQYLEGNHQLKDWMEKLKIGLSEADDLLDDLEIHSLRRQALQQSVLGKVRTFFSPSSNQFLFRFKMSFEIKKLRERFDEIASDRNRFNLAERLEERDVVVMRRETTHSFVDESGVFGRSLDKENIIRLLMHTTSDVELPVIPIVGIGGLGKTTLVQMVYNDRRVIDCFDLRIWVCISDDFILTNIILEILKSVTGADYRHLAVDQLQSLLRQKLQDKKYLLVLDDVWNEARDKWMELMELLTCSAAVGSRIIVTSRSELVAGVVAPTTQKYKLMALSDDDCLSLFLKWAFWKVEDANQHPNLVEIVREIVKKCKGNPLAVRTLGKLLYMKTEEREWLYVRDNDVWDSGQGEGDILPALKLSYYQLPSHLKQCFAYCSLFPKDHIIHEPNLIGIWRAQGLIRLEPYKTIEETGKEYVGLLLSRGFLQKYERLGVDGWYVIHDLVHDLAQSVAKPDCISTTYGPILHSSIKVQHLFLLVDNSRGDKVPNELLELKRQLRTFLFSWTPHGRYSTDSSFTSFIETSIPSFKLLRVLQLASLDTEVLPRSIGRLRHLRYLDLSYNSCIKSLPHSVCNLMCLETLNLMGCVELEKLPEGLGKLIRLKSLYVTTKERCLPEKEIRCLTSLQVLCVLFCENMEFLLSDDGMACLSSLRTLGITSCRRLLSLPIHGVRELHNLENLTLSGCENLDLQRNADIYSEARGRSGGLRGLRSLFLFGLPMLVSFPAWLLYGANSLKELIIFGCPNLTTLMPEPLLENLKYLQQLRINKCPELKSLPDGMHHLTGLYQFKLWNCPQLVSRCARETGEDWHKISHVHNIYLDGAKI